MKALLIVTTVLEAAVGSALLIAPAFVISTLLNTPLETPGGMAAARLAGAAIVALAICCWKSAGSSDKAAMGIVAGMLFYNFAAVAVLVHAQARMDLNSVFIWPTMVLHTILGLWCASVLWLSVRKALQPKVS